MSESQSEISRIDSRAFDQLRPVTVETGVLRNADASVFYRCGNTWVLCTATINDSVPGWMRGSNKGWLTAEYNMLPTSGHSRQNRDGRRGSIGGRTAEIQRLIGRSLRAAIDFKKLGERMITVDCDVLDADGGTRTASITGGYIATLIALHKLREQHVIPSKVVRSQVAAVSVGVAKISGQKHALLDLCYEEDSAAEMDLNVVGCPALDVSDAGRIVEIQGTAEGAPMERKTVDALVDLAQLGLGGLFKAQNEALEKAGVNVGALR